MEITSLDNQLLNIEQKIARLQEELKQARTNRDRIKEQKKKAVKSLDSLNKALSSVKKMFEEFGESAKELQNIAIARVREHFDLTPVKKTAKCLSPRTYPKSNEYFEWQTTNNPNLACYFDISKGKTHCTYIGSDNKSILDEVVASIETMFNCTIIKPRSSKQLFTKYEVKIWELNDNAIGWLSGFDYDKSFNLQLPERASAIEKIPENLKITSSNWLANSGAKIVNNLIPDCICSLVSIEEFKAVDDSGKNFIFNPDYWHISDRFFEEAFFVLKEMNNCSNKEELARLRYRSDINSKTVDFVWHSISYEQKAQIKSLCDRTEAVDIVSRIDILLRELRWGEVEKRTYLESEYGENSQIYLNDAQLWDFHDYLESLNNSQNIKIDTSLAS